MRRLAPLLLLSVACATTSPKRDQGDIEIDVLWEEAPATAPVETATSPTETVNEGQKAEAVARNLEQEAAHRAKATELAAARKKAEAIRVAAAKKLALAEKKLAAAEKRAAVAERKANAKERADAKKAEAANRAAAAKKLAAERKLAQAERKLAQAERKIAQAQAQVRNQNMQGQTPRSKTVSASSKKRVPEQPALHTSSYHLTYQGKRIGEARETFHRSKSGVRVIRHEEIRVRRGGVIVDSETEIVIHADKMLRATRVDLLARAGAVTRKGQALRTKGGQWAISLDGETPRRAPADAVPLELVPYVLARNGSQNYKSRVLLAGYGFAVTKMEVGHSGRRGTAILKTQWGDIKTQLQMSNDGALLRAATGSTGSVRVQDSRLKEKFTPPELLSMSTIPVTGKGDTLVIDNTNRQPPPALGGQSISLRKQGWRIQFDPERAVVSRRVAALTRQVDNLLSESHDAPGADAKAARELGRGDCTAHSTLFVDLAAQQGLKAKLVTGFRVNKDRLVRHRWVAVEQDGQWVQVDPTFGEAPVKPASHVALAIHDASTAQIALVDEAVFRGLGSAAAKWIRTTVAGR